MTLLLHNGIRLMFLKQLYIFVLYLLYIARDFGCVELPIVAFSFYFSVMLYLANSRVIRGNLDTPFLTFRKFLAIVC